MIKPYESILIHLVLLLQQSGHRSDLKVLIIYPIMRDEEKEVTLVDFFHFFGLADEGCRVLQQLSDLTQQVVDQLRVLYCCKEVGHHSWVFNEELEAVVTVALMLLDARTASADVVEPECAGEDAWSCSVYEGVLVDLSQPVKLFKQNHAFTYRYSAICLKDQQHNQSLLYPLDDLIRQRRT